MSRFVKAAVIAALSASLAVSACPCGGSTITPSFSTGCCTDMRVRRTPRRRRLAGSSARGRRPPVSA